ncbi:unnamed protein product [Notodromas monacha]|uniref:EF-hand domain-containing protein n=1 Tax=Notodromas monacha TaxID=399045 RepID=A0A7R9G9R2_9CRUS|nr:unnamed protein product [Notodromas monacha]CAG0912879.1 unnamed protein product [Notodromas monacha]
MFDKNWLREVFDACDVAKRGFVTPDQFEAVARDQFGVDSADIPVLFGTLDKDGDGKISFHDFAAGFGEYLQSRGLRRPSVASRRLSTSVEELSWLPMTSPSSKDTQNLLSTTEDEKKYLSCPEKLNEMERTHDWPGALREESWGDEAASVPELFSKLMADVMTLQEENSRLEGLYSRSTRGLHAGFARDPNGGDVRHYPVYTHSDLMELEPQSFDALMYREKEFLRARMQNFEEDMEAAMAEAETKAAAKVKLELKQEKKELEKKMETEKNKLQAHFHLYSKIDAWLKDEEKERRMIVEQTRQDLKSVQQENQGLRESLIEAQGNIAILHAQLARVRSCYEDKCREYEENNPKQRLSKPLHGLNVKLPFEVTRVSYGREGSNSLRSKRKFRLSLRTKDNANSEGSSCCSSCHELYTPRKFGHLTDEPALRGMISNSPSFRLDRFMNDLDSGRSTLRDFTEVDSEPPSILIAEADDDISTPSDCSLEEKVNPLPRPASRTLVKPLSLELAAAQYEDESIPYEPQLPKPTEIKNTYKVVLCGDSAVGKTSFINALCDGHFSLNLPTTLGQEKFRSITKTYFRRADGVILMYDVTMERSFLDIRKWLQDIEAGAGEGVPIILCGNKVEMRDSSDLRSKSVSFRDGSRLALEIGCIFIETSAKAGTNLEETLVSLCREMGARSIEEKRWRPVKMIHEPEEKKSSSCCISKKR